MAKQGLLKKVRSPLPLQKGKSKPRALQQMRSRLVRGPQRALHPMAKQWLSKGNRGLDVVSKQLARVLGSLR
uniref:Engorgement factor beta protein n=1 Tax=Amblyomma hebraeum TaxID=34608 RepID=Q6T254_AMBHE|nr:engorgement factor beta protein [Amblyomma hebraeum]